MILQSLDAEVLLRHRCFFAGGTAIVLTHGEYRESLDIDFMISNLEGYRDLRSVVTRSQDLAPLFRPGKNWSLARPLRADQYGIRTMIAVGSAHVKFEIVHEGRISFSEPGANPIVCGVTALSSVDMAASKLLANSDRWADDSVWSRDLIDLAMLNLSRDQKKLAIQKAEKAYGESVLRDLRQAIESLKNRRGRLAQCLDALKMRGLPEAVVWSNIRSLLAGC